MYFRMIKVHSWYLLKHIHVAIKLYYNTCITKKFNIFRQSDSWPTLPYNTLQYLQYHIIVVTNTVIRLVTQRPEAVASEVKFQLTNQIPDLLYPTIPYNTYITIL